jgi:hypothetical protein
MRLNVRSSRHGITRPALFHLGTRVWHPRPQYDSGRRRSRKQRDDDRLKNVSRAASQILTRQRQRKANWSHQITGERDRRMGLGSALADAGRLTRIPENLF